MTKFSLSSGEMLEVLDKLNGNAYDKLVNAIEEKICKVLPEKKWIEMWEDGDFKIEMSITIPEIEELKDA
jgi:hypothetical protein